MVDRSLLKSLLRMLADLQIYQGINTLKSLVHALIRIFCSAILRDAYFYS